MENRQQLLPDKEMNKYPLPRPQRRGHPRCHTIQQRPF